MKIKSSILVFLISLMGCSTFQVQTMPISRESIRSGQGQTVNMKGNPLPLAGSEIKVGDPLPEVVLTATDLSPLNLAETRGQVRIISVVPSLDTPVCEEQTHTLSEKNEGLDRHVQLITISMDLPFAQKRFSKAAAINNILFLSDYRSAQFGEKFGLLVEPLRLLSRAVLVIDKENIVQYVQVVPELTHLPDLDLAMQVAKSLL